MLVLPSIIESAAISCIGGVLADYHICNETSKRGNARDISEVMVDLIAMCDQRAYKEWCELKQLYGTEAMYEALTDLVEKYL